MRLFFLPQSFRRNMFLSSFFRLSFVFIFFSGKFYAFFTSTCARMYLCTFEFNDMNNKNRIRLICTNTCVQLSLSQVSFTELRVVHIIHFYLSISISIFAFLSLLLSQYFKLSLKRVMEILLAKWWNSFAYAAKVKSECEKRVRYFIAMN